jgi:hypothetical protein
LTASSLHPAHSGGNQRLHRSVPESARVNGNSNWRLPHADEISGTKCIQREREKERELHVNRQTDDDLLCRGRALGFQVQEEAEEVREAQEEASYCGRRRIRTTTGTARVTHVQEDSRQPRDGRVSKVCSQGARYSHEAREINHQEGGFAG